MVRYPGHVLNSALKVCYSRWLEFSLPANTLSDDFTIELLVRYSDHGLNNELLVCYSGHDLNNKLLAGI